MHVDSISNSAFVVTSGNGSIGILKTGPSITVTTGNPDALAEQATRARTQQVFGEIAGMSDADGAKTDTKQHTKAMAAMRDLEGKYGAYQMEQIFGVRLKDAMAKLPSGPGATYTKKQRDFMNALQKYHERASKQPYGMRPPLDATAAAAVAVARTSVNKPLTAKELTQMRASFRSKDELKTLHWAATAMEGKAGMSKEERLADRKSAKRGVERSKATARSKERATALSATL